MEPLKCNKCGYILTNEQNEKFCPNCGATLDQNPEISTNTEKGVFFCPNCGVAISSPDAKFCPSCGTGLNKELGQATTTTPPLNVNFQASPLPPISAPQRVPQKLVAGSLLKSVPFANMIVPEGKLPGSIQLRRDGVLFITKTRQVIQSHITDITNISEAGEKNVITLTLISGEKRTFAFAGASRWVDKIQQLQSM